jgi:hypothetical protein
MILILVLQMLKRFARFLQDALTPIQQLFAEIFPLALIHERLFVGWAIAFVLIDPHAVPILDFH